VTNSGAAADFSGEASKSLRLLFMMAAMRLVETLRQAILRRELISAA
jgi:hypothetical protein